MEKIILYTKKTSIHIGNGDEFIQLQRLNSQYSIQLKAPVFEVMGKKIGGKSWKLIDVISEKELVNGGRECTFKYIAEDNKNVELLMILRYFNESPFIRFKYVMQPINGEIHLTKKNQKDEIKYSGFDIPIQEDYKVTEIQLSQFESNVHSFMPNLQNIDSFEIKHGIKYPGPITYLEFNDYGIMMGYEHGAEYPNSNFIFTVNENNALLQIDLIAAKGNYYNKEIINRSSPFNSVWFHIALDEGDNKQLFASYREFFLKYISENTKSRYPYIFYNTWNNQERNKYYKDLPYLYSMHLEHILKEIDIAHRMGVDVFVIDTGWYTKTGDWLVNLDRFPDGLKRVKEKLNAYNMELGLWFNPIVAAKTSEIYMSHPEYVIQLDGKDEFVGQVWETEESYGMCLASGYSDFFIKKMIQLNQELGVTYFKWDAIWQYGCDSPFHNHGTHDNSPQERRECYSYKMGLEMIRIVEEVTKQCPDIIVDFDITEGERFVGLGFLSVGKFFLMNNGPYFNSFDIPDTINIEPNTINVFFHPGAARAKICRQGLRFDQLIPSILFLTHFLPDPPRESQVTSLASLMLGSNGIWGDLLSLSNEDIELFHNTLNKYKKIAVSITESYPRTKGFIGSSPEIYEKINYETAKGVICFFTRAKGKYQHITQPININNFNCIEGADEYELTPDNNLIITVKLEKNESKYVFLM